MKRSQRLILFEKVSHRPLEWPRYIVYLRQSGLWFDEIECVGFKGEPVIGPWLDPR
jgi:hypothetical protein